MSIPETVGVTYPLWELLATVIFVLLNGFFVAAEFSLVKVRLGEVESLAVKGNRRARLVMKMIGRLDHYLSACQLGITLASLILGWLAEPAVATLLITVAKTIGIDIVESTWVHPVALVISLAVITMLHMTIGEQAPKMWSIQRSKATILTVAYPLYGFATALKPMIWLINWISNSFVRLGGGIPTSEHQSSYDLAEIRMILNAAAKSGQLTQRQKLFGENVLGLADMEVRHVMVPRTEVAYLSTANSTEDNLAIVQKTGHSRFPLADPDLDNVKNLVLARSLLNQMLSGNPINLPDLAHECPTVPDTQPLSRLIRVLQEQQTHCASVIDEHGTTVGFAFMEDAIEEIVGPMDDEFDHIVSKITETAPGVIEVAGEVAIPEASHLLSFEFDDECDTIGGLVVAHLGRLPKVGETVEIGPYIITVLSATRRRVTRLQFKKIQPKDLNLMPQKKQEPA